MKLDSIPGHGAWIDALSDDIQPARSDLTATTCTIGRSPLCQVVVRRRTVSRLHAKIELLDHVYLLIDTDSANGTFVNGQRIFEPCVLANHDQIGLGAPEAILRFWTAGPALCRSKLPK